MSNFFLDTVTNLRLFLGNIKTILNKSCSMDEHHPNSKMKNDDLGQCPKVYGEAPGNRAHAECVSARHHGLGMHSVVRARHPAKGGPACIPRLPMDDNTGVALGSIHATSTTKTFLPVAVVRVDRSNRATVT